MEEAGGIEDGSVKALQEGLVTAMDVQRLFQNMAIGDGLIQYVTKAINNIYGIVNSSGVQMLIFLAGLSRYPLRYTNPFRLTVLHHGDISENHFPMISPMILVNAV